MNNFKPAFFLLLCLAALPMQAQQLTALVPIPNVPPGTSGAVQVTLSVPTIATQPVALQFTINGTAETGTMTATIGAAASAAGKTLACTPGGGTMASGAQGPMTCVLYGGDATSVNTPIGNGDVVDVSIPVLATAKNTNEAITLSASLGVSAAGTALTISSFSGSFSVFSSCDLDHSGVTDLADLALVLAQADKQVPACSTGDLNKDGKCDVMDVYREVLSILPASSGVTGAGVCKVGP